MFTDLLVVLYVEDIDRALTLYRDVMGATETYRFPRTGSPEHVELRLGTSIIGLSAPSGLVPQGLPPVTRGGQPFELAIGTADVDRSLEALRAAGCHVVREPFDTEAGNRTAYIEDFDGNRISIYARRR